MKATRNTKNVCIVIPSEAVLHRINSTPTLKRLTRLILKVGANVETVNHKQFADMVRLLPILGVLVTEIN